MSESYISAIYAGRCRCGQHFEQGTLVRWDSKRRRVTACQTCHPTPRVVKRGGRNEVLEPGSPWPPDEG